MVGFNPNEYDCVVGIDFGTTYSGCSYAFNIDKVIRDITKWPQQTGHYPKTPTVLLYKDGSKETDWWGEKAHYHFWFKKGYKDMRYITRFKLLLDKKSDLPRLPNNLETIQVITDYLKLFHRYVLENIRPQMSSLNIRYCLTVPAMWTDEAKITMRTAAVRAGLIHPNDHPDKLTLISEPEAAALYCQKYSKEFNLNHGQQFLICDAGGGTVDLVVFEIEDRNNSRHLKEISTVKGDRCGSTYIDELMKSLIYKKLGKKVSISSILIEEMVKEFVNEKKPNFGEDMDDDDEMYINIPPAMYNNNPELFEGSDIEEGEMYFTNKELETQVFGPVISKIIDLIYQQLSHPNTKKPMDAMFMVGGFSTSPYLQYRLKKEFSNKIKLISVPPRNEMAIARGAVLLGIQPNIISQRIARHTYGLQTRAQFDSNLDPECFRLNSTEFCDVRFDRLITKNEELPSDARISKKYVINTAVPTRIALFAFDAETPIPRWTRSFNNLDIIKVGEFYLKLPNNIAITNKDAYELTVHFYFGKTEIKIETNTLGVIETFNLHYSEIGQK